MRTELPPTAPKRATLGKSPQKAPVRRSGMSEVFHLMKISSVYRLK
jgi:hypothetical protein